VTDKGICRCCMTRQEVAHAQHRGGGGYNRPHRWYDSSICEGCTDALLSYTTTGSHTVSNWGVHSLTKAKEEFERTSNA
jgi:hypothetical protein